MPAPRKIGSSDCGPNVQFAPIACTFLCGQFRRGFAGARASEGGALFGIRQLRDDGQRENERIASIAASNTSMLEKCLQDE